MAAAVHETGKFCFPCAVEEDQRMRTFSKVIYHFNGNTDFKDMKINIDLSLP